MIKHFLWQLIFLFINHDTSDSIWNHFLPLRSYLIEKRHFQEAEWEINGRCLVLLVEKLIVDHQQSIWTPLLVNERWTKSLFSNWNKAFIVSFKFTSAGIRAKFLSHSIISQSFLVNCMPQNVTHNWRLIDTGGRDSLLSGLATKRGISSKCWGDLRGTSTVTVFLLHDNLTDELL